MAAVHQHRQALLRQQTSQQRCEVGQLARAVVAGDDHHGLGLMGLRPHGQTLLGGVEKACQLFGAFALETHGNAKAAQLQITDLAVQHLPHQIAGLGPRKRARALGAATDFLDVVADAHD